MRLPVGVRQIRGENYRDEDYPHKELTEKIIGCAIWVHRALRAGFVEVIYENALAHELAKSGLHGMRQVKYPVFYDGVQVGEHRADMVVDGKVVVELKAASGVTDQHVSQVMSTMIAARMEVGLLLNFGEAKLVDGLRRIVIQKKDSPVLPSEDSAPLR